VLLRDPSIQLNPITFFVAAAHLHSPRENPNAERACGAREHWWRPLSIRNDFRGWFYPPTFLISAMRPPRYRDSGATLRRFELRGEPREYGLTPGSFRRGTERRLRGERSEGKGGKEDRRGRIDKKGRGIERVSSRCLFFTSRKSHTRAGCAPHGPRSQIQ